MMVEFDQSFEIGHRMIDGEHRQLIGEINQLLDVCAGGGSAAKVNRALQLLSHRLDQHFAHEESLQLQYGYPHYERHQHLHDSYRDMVRRLIGEYLQSGPSPDMIIKLSNNIGGWFLNHIKREDKEMAAFIRVKSRTSS